MPTPCPHSSTVLVLVRPRLGRRDEQRAICRLCHRIRLSSGALYRWEQQTAAPGVGAHYMPVLGREDPPGYFQAPTFTGDPEPPYLLPVVPAAFDRAITVGSRATFCASVWKQLYVEAVVVFVGEAQDGARGFVAVTEAGVTLRGGESIPLAPKGIPAAWMVRFFGDVEELQRIVAIQREEYPREVA